MQQTTHWSLKRASPPMEKGVSTGFVGQNIGQNSHSTQSKQFRNVTSCRTVLTEHIFTKKELSGFMHHDSQNSESFQWENIIL